MLYMAVYVVWQESCVNNFAIEIAEINSEVKHFPQKKNKEQRTQVGPIV